MSANPRDKMLTTFLAFIAIDLTHFATVQGLDFRGMGDNCILSFVVPKDKVKSSCDMEERVVRRLNAMETKVGLFTNHIQELQEQLRKEKESHSQTLEELEERLSEAEPDHKTDGLLQKRIQQLEEEVKRLSTVHLSSPTVSNMGIVSNAAGASEDVIASRMSKEFEETPMLNLIRPMVHREIEKLFDNYTVLVGRYVRDQTIAFNQVINMVPGNQEIKVPVPPKWSEAQHAHASNVLGSTKDSADAEMVLSNELTSIKIKMEAAGKKLVDQVRKALTNVISTSSTTETITTTIPLEATLTTLHADHTTSIDNKMDNLTTSFDLNDTSSGDGNETSNVDTFLMEFLEDGNKSSPVENSTTKNVDIPLGEDSITDASSPAKSRMSQKPKASGTDLSEDKTESNEVIGNQSTWEEEMLDDQSQGGHLKEFLQTEIQKVLKDQMNEVLSLMSKYTVSMDSRLEDQEVQFKELDRKLSKDVKQLEQEISGVKLEIVSTSQGVQTLFARTEKLDELKTDVENIKKNMSSENNTNSLVNKLDRLLGVYKTTLADYRNLTELEYRDVKERLMKEVGQLRSQHDVLYANVTSDIKLKAEQVNESVQKQMSDIKQRIQVMEDNTVLLQIDLSSFEDKLKNRNSKSEKELNNLKDSVNIIHEQVKILQKDSTLLQSHRDNLFRAVNVTASEVSQLKMEVKLNLLDDWMPYEFNYVKTRTDCFGAQYIKKSGFKTGRLVGVVLCMNIKDRYKIFLAQSPTDTFKNIADENGLGEDHCQFVGAKDASASKVGRARTAMDTELGYLRANWGQEPKSGLINGVIRVSPVWYECGVVIP